MALKPPSIRRRKYNKKDDCGDRPGSDDILSSSQIVEEAQRENMLHRGLSDLLMGCCTGLEVDVGADESDNAFDISRELEELEKEISLAKEMKKSAKGAKDVETEDDASGDKKQPNDMNVGRNRSTPTSPLGPQADAMGAISSAVSSSSSSLLSSSASWTEQMSESVESNIKFLVGSCSSRQVQVDSIPKTAFEV